MFDVGDLVVCVDDRTSRGSPHVEVRKGRAYRVAFYNAKSDYHDIFGHDCGKVHLAEVACDNRHGFAAARFRKIDAPDTEVSRLIRACKPVRQGQPA